MVYFLRIIYGNGSSRMKFIDFYIVNGETHKNEGEESTLWFREWTNATYYEVAEEFETALSTLLHLAGWEWSEERSYSASKNYRWLRRMSFPNEGEALKEIEQIKTVWKDKFKKQLAKKLTDEVMFGRRNK